VSKILLDAFDKPQAQIPFWFMRQAGRYLPEYMHVRNTTSSFIDFCFSPDKATEVTLQPIRRFGPSAAIIFADILLIPIALGQTVEFIKGRGPVLGDLDYNNLAYNDDVLKPVCKTVSNCRAELPGNVALFGFAGSPWTVATYMVEGGSSKDYTKIKAKLNTAEFDKLIDVLIESTIDYLSNQIQAGADILQLFDSWAGALQGDDYNKYVVEPNHKIVAALKSKFNNKIIGFPKGSSITQYTDFIKNTSVDGVSIDYDISLDDAVKLQQYCLVQGNMHPKVLLGSKLEIKQEATKIMDALAGGKFIFNLGHGITPDVPPENVDYLAEVIKGY